MTLTSFPRGGKKPLNKSFDSLKKTKRIKTNYDKKNDNEIEDISNEAKLLPSSADCLSYRHLKPGMVVLGRIHAATDYDLSVSLPGRLSGYVQITDISTTYTDYLQKLSVSPQNYPADFKLLSNLFKRGDYVVCYIKKVDTELKQRVTMSIEPEFINQYLDPSRLNKSSNVVCSVSSVEEHGYAIDTGIPNFRAFLMNQDIDEDTKYYPGQQIFCVVKTISSSQSVYTAKLSTKTKHMSSTVTIDGQSIDALVPGTKFNLIVKKLIKNGLCVSYNGENIGCINQTHLTMPLVNYEIGSTIVASLMYVIPIVKLAYFTQLTLKKEELIIDSGEIINNAKYLYRDTGIILSLKKNIKGVISFLRTNVNYDDIPKVFTKNSAHTCRVMTYDMMDRLHVCTMQKHMLDPNYTTAETLKVGDIITVEIMEYKKNGFVFVKSHNVLGDVPFEEIIDRDQNDNDKPKVGDKCEARVLSKSPKGNRFLFTLKKSLIENDLPIFSKIDDAIIKNKYVGSVVMSTPKKGLLVRFYGDIKGWLPINAMRPMTPENYKIGETICVKLTSIKDDNKKILLSLVKNKNDEKIIKPKTEDLVNLKIGDTVEGIVVESDVNGIQMNIIINNDKAQKVITAFLPAGHMSPSKEIGSSLASRYLPGDILAAFVFSITPEFLLTRTFLPTKSYSLPKRLKVNDIIPISVKEINDKHLKVIIPVKGIKEYGHVNISQAIDINTLSMYSVIYGKVTVRKPDECVTLTTLLDDILSQKQGDYCQLSACDNLAMYLNKIKEISKHHTISCKPISKLHVGQQVAGVVEKVTDNGLVLKLDNDVSAIVRNDQLKGSYKEGYKVKGIVLWINYIHDVVEVSLLTHLLSGNSKGHFHWSEIAKNDKTILKGEIIIVTPWFALIRFSGGRIGAIPIKKHVNDTEPDFSIYKVGGKVRCSVVLNDPDCMLPICFPKRLKKLKLPKTVLIKTHGKRKHDDVDDDDKDNDEDEDEEDNNDNDETVLPAKKLKKEIEC
ncbi:protein RRP5 homolog [Aphidius gifuensis]|uniref:protein RRP5 homolog n=1 Tax=Aphidius gifuensis TaxID=684658 RepID=UPI001CDCA7C4|nr:protein RRP5 homolog [Aphidius gifuensis]